MLYLLDVSGFIFRAYHALPPLLGPQKEPIGALFGFCSMLIKLLDQIPKEATLVAVFDSKTKNFRHHLYAEYKAHRPPPPEDLIAQFDFVKNACDAFDIMRAEHSGFEADDVIASYVQKASCSCVIVSSDKDLMQLLSDRVSFLDPITYQQKTSDDVVKKFGVRVDQLTDLLALMGDQSDNVPGVPGIGVKTASELLCQFGSLEKIYENIVQIKQKKRQETLLSYKDQAFLSKKLVQLSFDVPVSEAKSLPLDSQKIYSFLKKWGFESLIKRTESFLGDSSVSEPLPFFYKPWPPQHALHGTLYVGENIKTDLDVPYDDTALMGMLLNRQGSDDYLSLKDDLVEKKLTTLYERIERPIGRVLYHLEKSGILIDLEALEKAEIFYKIQQKDLEDHIFKQAGTSFNLASPKQLGEVLFNEMKLPLSKKTKTGAFVTDANILEELDTQGFSIAGDILKWRMYAKLLSSYVESFRTHLNHETKRIHTEYTVALTGRLISSNPNLQTIPIKTPEGRMIRQCFIAPQGSSLVSFDYSQIELRLLAFLGPVPELQEAFIKGQDIHEATAKTLFGGASTELRRIAKTINFGILYGISGYGLSQQLKLPAEECNALIAQYFERYPSILNYQKTCEEFAKRHGYVETLFKRRVYLPDIQSANHIKRQFAKRQAVNAPLQGSNADILKKAMIALWKQIQNTPLKMVLSIHDELVFEIPNHLQEEWEVRIQQTMETIAPFPLKVKSELWSHES